ncbi:hypothetical protein [Sulfuriflexus mobilis]|uniref:hypothetical protein n=1 Tax=Sulfuriflexus mobilis TaxID=1811807 RepID=UPI000F819FDC|nr:hypothetical protein [Sulfuriflexus mobilis]
MDTTIALIFTLGLALGSQDSVTMSGHQPSTPTQNTQHHMAQRQQRVRQRILLTNAWLKQQKQTRRSLLAQHKQNPLPTQLAGILVCTADWDTV